MQENRPPTVSDKKDQVIDKPAAGADTASARVMARPVIVTLGSTRRKRIKELKRGTGKLMDKVRDAVELVATDLGREADGQKLLPVVLVYKEKSRGKGRRGGPNGMCPVCCV